MKYAVAWVNLDSKKEIVYEIYDTKVAPKVPYLRFNTREATFISDLPEDRKIWNARLIIWVD